MPTKTSSADLQGFFRGELEDDANATLGRAKRRLESLRDSGPEDEQLARLDNWILEMDELIRVHGSHCSLTEFV
jgi:hypothetical protein